MSRYIEQILGVAAGTVPVIQPRRPEVFEDAGAQEPMLFGGEGEPAASRSLARAALRAYPDGVLGAPSAHSTASDFLATETSTAAPPASPVLVPPLAAVPPIPVHETAASISSSVSSAFGARSVEGGERTPSSSDVRTTAPPPADAEPRGIAAPAAAPPPFILAPAVPATPSFRAHTDSPLAPHAARVRAAMRGGSASETPQPARASGNGEPEVRIHIDRIEVRIPPAQRAPIVPKETSVGPPLASYLAQAAKG